MSQDNNNDESVPESASSLDEQLMQAAIDEKLDTMKELLESRANAAYNKYIEGTWGAYDQYSVIHKVLNWRDVSQKRRGVELLLKAGADVNGKYGSANWKGSDKLVEPYGSTFPICEFLLSTTGSSGTAFEMAMRSNDDEIIRLFLEHGADPNTMETREAHTMRYDGRRAYPVLYSATQRLKVDLVKCLLEKGALPNARGTNRGQSEYGPIDDTEEIALHAACMNYCSLHRDNQNSECYEEFDEDEEENEGETSDFKEKFNKARKDCEKIVRYLLEAGSDVNTQKRHVEHVSVERVGVSEDDYEANDPRSDRYVPSTKNVWTFSTALHMALMNKNERLVKLLLAHGADTRIPYREDEQNTTCLELTKQQEPFLSLIKNGFEWTPENHELLPSN